MKNIILIAPPGGGKGTLSKELLKKYQFNHISTGDLLRDKAKTNIEIDNLLKNGMFVSDDIVLSLIKENIIESNINYILDGYPRTINQAKSLEKLLVDIKRNDYKVIVINLPYEEIKKRITGRYLCSQCGAIYNIYHDAFKPKHEGICDKCQHKLYQRSDDNEETFINRYQKYQNESKPILEFYKDKIYNLDGMLELEEKLEKVMEVLND